MEKKMTDLTDLQLTMALILNDRGISLEEQRVKRVTIDTNSISVEEKNMVVIGILLRDVLYLLMKKLRLYQLLATLVLLKVLHH